MQSFTQEDLVQFLYHESSPEKAAQIKAALEADWNLREQFEMISSASKSLADVAHPGRRRRLDPMVCRRAMDPNQRLLGGAGQRP